MQAVQFNKFSDQDFQEMYSRYATDSLEAFKKWCAEAIDNKSVSSKEKKDGFKRSMMPLTSKDRIVKKMTDFFIAGEGLKSIR